MDNQRPPPKRAKVDNDRYKAVSSTSPANQDASTVPAAQSEPVRFQIQPLNRFQGASASIKRPREIAHFSYDENHEYRDDESGIQYYYNPRIGANLCDGFDTFRHYEDKEDPHLDSLLKALMGKEKRDNGRIQGDFVTWRGMMTKVNLFCTRAGQATQVCQWFSSTVVLTDLDHDGSLRHVCLL